MALVCSALMALGVASFAWADPILPGFDALHTPPGGAFLPSPFGTIPLMSAPFSPALGDADTLVQRFGSLGPGGTGVIEAEIVALTLKSIAPVFVPPIGDAIAPQQGGFFDVFVTLDPSRRSMGNLTITSHVDPGGGTFDSHFDVFVKAIFTEVGGGETFTIFSDSDGDAIDSFSSLWSHVAPPLYPPDLTLFDLPSGDPLFDAGNFFPGVTTDPRTGNPIVVGIVHTGPHPNTVPAQVIPEPSSLLLLLGSGLAAAAALGRKRLRR